MNKELTMDSLLPKSRICTKCGEEKLLGEFYRNSKGKYGVESQCKLCKKQYHEANREQKKQYREANKEKIAERHKQYYDKNKEQKLKKVKQYREENKESYKEYQKQYCQDNKEKIAEKHKQNYQKNRKKIIERTKQYKQDNKEQINERQRNRNKNDEQFRIRRKLSSGLRSALNKIGKTKNASILTYIGCSIGALQEHLNSTKKPDWGDDLHIDHIIPSSSFDHANEEEIKRCWNWRNLRYLPAKENISKQDTLDMDLVKSYGIEDLLPREEI